MSLWFILALMTAVAIFAVLWPLGRRPALGRAGSDVAVYRDQLDELDRDKRAGLIGAAEADAARVEVGRRLLTAADAAAGRGEDAAAAVPARRKVAAVAAFTLLPIGAVALYVGLGSPGLPDAPLASRTQAHAPLEDQPIMSLIARVEAHLEGNPEDGRGWEVLAPIYLRLGRFEDAVSAWQKVLRLMGPTAAREAEYGEALVYAANGVVTGEAKEAFERALKHDPNEVKARFFLGLAAEQDGKREQAAAIWRAMLADAPPDASWVELVRQALARVEGAPATGPSADDVAAVEGLPPDQRAQMIRGMVERLAARLKADGSDVEGWLRLVRAYVVLGERDKAKAAAADARKAIAGDEAKLRRVDDLVKSLGLET